MSPPLEAAIIVLILGVTVGVIISVADPVKLPEKENTEGPLPSLPSVTI